MAHEQSRELEDVSRRIDAEAATVNPFAADTERLREALAAGAARLGALGEDKAKAAAEVDRCLWSFPDVACGLNPDYSPPLSSLTPFS